jgi:hypothetical protein
VSHDNADPALFFPKRLFSELFDFSLASIPTSLFYNLPVLRIRDPGWAKNQDLGSWIRDEHPESYSESSETIFKKILKFFDADPESEIFFLGFGIKEFVSRVRDKHFGSATLQASLSQQQQNA